jgi:hypothetical protein
LSVLYIFLFLISTQDNKKKQMRQTKKEDFRWAKEVCSFGVVLMAGYNEGTEKSHPISGGFSFWSEY